MRVLVEKAKTRKLQLDDLRGGTFTLSNYGPFGGVYATPMILPPQTGIMGTGRMHKMPVVENDEVKAAWTLPAAIRFDHRVVDGATASAFISYFLNLLHSPEKFLINI